MNKIYIAQKRQETRGRLLAVAGVMIALLALPAGNIGWAACCSANRAESCAQADAAAPNGCVESDGPSTQDDGARKWYLCIGNSNNHPRLNSAEEKIDAEVNRTFRLLAPSFDDVRTFSDQRDEMMIWTPFLIVGRTLSDRWNVFAQTGYTAGTVRTRYTDPSLLLLPLHTDISFKRSTFYAGMGAEYFPWGMPSLRKYESWGERLRNAKPLLGATMNWNYLTADGDIRAGLLPFGNFIRREENEVWRAWNLSAILGLSIPLGPRTAFCVNTSYNFFFDYADDFSGPSFSSFWQWRF